MAPLMAVAAIAGTVMSAAAAKQQGDAARAEANAQAELQKRAAAQHLAEATAKRDEDEAKGNLLESDNARMQAAGGIGPNSSSFKNVMNMLEVHKRAHMAGDVAEGRNAQSMGIGQANVTTAAGKNAQTAGNLAAAADLFTGVSKVGMGVFGPGGSGGYGLGSGTGAGNGGGSLFDDLA